MVEHWAETQAGVLVLAEAVAVPLPHEQTLLSSPVYGPSSQEDGWTQHRPHGSKADQPWPSGRCC